MPQNKIIKPNKDDECISYYIPQIEYCENNKLSTKIMYVSDKT